MAKLGTLDGRRVIYCHTDIGIDQLLCDASGTPIGYELSSMFDPHIAQAQHRLETLARKIAAKAAQYEPSSFPMPRLRDYREG